MWAIVTKYACDHTRTCTVRDKPVSQTRYDARMCPMCRSDLEKKKFRIRARANLDQDWAKAANWVNTSDPLVVKLLVDLLADDDVANLITWMASDKDRADIVSRLALLSLHEVASRGLERKGV